MRTLYAFLLAGILGCCSGERRRPEDVPPTALWKGGIDGGAWVEFVAVKPTEVEARIFYESGELWAQGIFKKKGTCDINLSNIKDEIVAFDGESLLTYKNCSFAK